MIGLFYAKNDETYRTFQVSNHVIKGVRNQLKAIAWSPDSKQIATMYHYDFGGHIELVDAINGNYLHTYKLNSYCHCPYFSKDGMFITCGSERMNLK